ncbi:hypothetical protein KBC80_02470 [Candidatus Woesebacteria bacterium]|jgi:hypothetical protein|nr:hypothetical protein [Candidatus Woesebacteria bacterium]
MAGRKRKETSNDQQSSFVGMEQPSAPKFENPNLLPNGKTRSKRQANGTVSAWHKPYVTVHEKRIAVRGWRIFDLIMHNEESSTLRAPPRDRSITFVGQGGSAHKKKREFKDYIFPQPGDDVNWEGLRKLAAMAREILKKK